eukprot:gnl/MRDRNA2_/MRDRNA2_32379_c0_seq2.p1 gnl/MRDRNA2_/MRDRNA2_32379_c0~~gnl/MRDRNA2_/MRDRNA2_32379_c0_seq2.p1  ORF type:complete len:278 (-),score=46.84 gnl/MRDRNA2_/MRDRNA2_32379_c0_seq2:93-926(-)
MLQQGRVDDQALLLEVPPFNAQWERNLFPVPFLLFGVGFRLFLRYVPCSSGGQDPAVHSLVLDSRRCKPNLDEDGEAEPFVKESSMPGGGLGLFTVGKPRPIQYRRNASRAGAGFLSAEDADALWESQSDVCAQYLMEVGLDTQWYRDEVEGNGALRHITEVSRYTDFGQVMEWDDSDDSIVLVRGDRNIYIPLIDPVLNPAAYANDACFGKVDPGVEPDLYDKIDALQNPLEQIPCLTRGEDGKLWWSSVWLYPRAGWDCRKPLKGYFINNFLETP